MGRAGFVGHSTPRNLNDGAYAVGQLHLSPTQSTANRPQPSVVNAVSNVMGMGSKSVTSRPSGGVTETLGNAMFDAGGLGAQYDAGISESR